jgi:DMSO/TMAO reductase YedYZ molybdopterin-dependent catalytic subunit
MKKSFTLMRARQRDRRHLLRGAVAAAGSAFLTGCDKLSQNESFVDTLKSAQRLSRAAAKVVAPRPAMAQEFGPEAVAQSFRGNGTLSPGDADYVALRNADFAGYKLTVGGLVEKPADFTLEQLRAMPSRTQITRHDCVEGWSAIGKWQGVPLSQVLDLAGLKPGARYVIFHCADNLGETADDSGLYYESIDLLDAYHPQTILAYMMNGQDLPVAHGAPLRLRIERQLGYKQAKYVNRIEVADAYSHLNGGKGGFWEDRGYEWYAGI